MRYTTFEGIEIAKYDVSESHGRKNRRRYTQTEGGAVDLDGTSRSTSGVQSWGRSGVNLGDTEYAAMLALDGTIGKLSRSKYDGSASWINARFDMDLARTTSDGAGYVHRVNLTFTSVESDWHGERYSGTVWFLDGGDDLDVGLDLDDTAEEWTLSSGSNAIALPNEGDGVLWDHTLTLIPDGGDLTALTITDPYGQTIELPDGESVSDGDSLVIYCGRKYATNDGVTLRMDTSPRRSHWMELAANGGSEIDFDCTLSAGTCALTMEGYAAWR